MKQVCFSPDGSVLVCLHLPRRLAHHEDGSNDDDRDDKEVLDDVVSSLEASVGVGDILPSGGTVRAGVGADVPGGSNNGRRGTEGINAEFDRTRARGQAMNGGVALHDASRRQVRTGFRLCCPSRGARLPRASRWDATLKVSNVGVSSCDAPKRLVRNFQSLFLRERQERLLYP